MTVTPDRPPTIVDPTGRPLRRAKDETVCPRCAAGPEKRVPSGGFGVPHPVCECGHEWFDEVWRG